MKVNPLYQRKMYNLSVQITKTPKKQRNERIKEHKRQNRYSLPTKRQLSRTNLNRLPPPFEIHSHQIPLPLLQQHFQLGSFVLSFFPRSTNTSTQMPQISNPSQFVKAFSHPKLNPVTKTTQIQPKTEEGKVEIKAQREKGEANGYWWWWWRSRVRPWLRRERESEIAERGSETDLVVEGYNSGGCGGVFVSWIEA